MADDTVTLKEHFAALIGGLEIHMNLRFDSMDKALLIQKSEMERRLEGLNHKEKELTIWRESTIKTISDIAAKSLIASSLVSFLVSVSGLFFLWLTFIKK